MALNPNISLAVRGIELQDPLAQYGKFAAIQGAQQQNQLAQMQMQEYERTRAEEEGLRNYLSSANLTDPAARQGLMKYGKTGLAYGTALSAQEKAALEQQETRLKVQKGKQDFMSQALRDISRNPSDANITAYLEDLAANPLFSPEEKASVRSTATRILAMPVEQRGAFMASQGATPSELSPTITSQTLGATTRLLSTPKQGGPATVVPGSEARITLAPGEAERIKNEGLRIGLEGRRLAVAEESQRRDADPEFQQRMANAKALGEAVAKGDVAAQQSLPKVINRAEEGLRLIDALVGQPEVRDKSGKVIQPATKPHPGFENAVGSTWAPGVRFIPGTDAADFMARYEQLKGTSFLEAFESLKGGGAITEKEGAKATDAINRMSTSQSEQEFKTAARDLQAIIRKGVSAAQARAARTGAPAAPIADPLEIR